MSSFKHILVPVDFGDAMQPGVDLAISMAQKLDARLTLLHTFDVTPFTTLARYAPPVDVGPIIASAERELAKVLASVQATWPKSDSAFRQGAPQDAIIEAAGALGCDLIVIGTHGRHGVARLLLGSVAERIVRLSPIPVLTVHPSAPAK
jgi:nucleotide-binding universal stress UspA family protein